MNSMQYNIMTALATHHDQIFDAFMFNDSLEDACKRIASSYRECEEKVLAKLLEENIDD